MPSIQAVIAGTVALASLSSAEVFKITAQPNNRFDPEILQCKVGDVLEFHFQSANHSVVAGDYHNACSPMAMGTGFFSGFFSAENGENDKVFRVVVNNTEPIPFYSSQGNECAKGMSGIVNPTEAMSINEYRSRACSLSLAVSPGTAAFGGEVVSEGSAVGSSPNNTPSYSGNNLTNSNNRPPTGSYKNTAPASANQVPSFVMGCLIWGAFHML